MVADGLDIGGSVNCCVVAEFLDIGGSVIGCVDADDVDGSVVGSVVSDGLFDADALLKGSLADD